MINVAQCCHAVFELKYPSDTVPRKYMPESCALALSNKQTNILASTWFASVFHTTFCFVPSVPSSYGPTSNLPILGTLLDKLVHIQFIISTLKHYVGNLSASQH